MILQPFLQVLNPSFCHCRCWIRYMFFTGAWCDWTCWTGEKRRCWKILEILRVFEFFFILNLLNRSTIISFWESRACYLQKLYLEFISVFRLTRLYNRKDLIIDLTLWPQGTLWTHHYMPFYRPEEFNLNKAKRLDFVKHWII